MNGRSRCRCRRIVLLLSAVILAMAAGPPEIGAWECRQGHLYIYEIGPEGGQWMKTTAVRRWCCRYLLNWKWYGPRANAFCEAVNELIEAHQPGTAAGHVYAATYIDACEDMPPPTCDLTDAPVFPASGDR